MKFQTIFLSLGFLIVGFVGGFFVFQAYSNQGPEKATAKAKCDFEFINPLRCDPENEINIKEYVALRNEILDYIADEQSRDMVTDVSVYFRDLESGSVMSINGQESFVPASLLKVPLMITVFKKAEADPSILKKRLRIVGDVESTPQNIKPQNPVSSGNDYTVEELVNSLITQSDNVAWKALLNFLGQEYSDKDFVFTLSDLGIIDPKKLNEEQYITVQSYSSIFRILYNSSYLSHEMSDKALGILSNSVFKDGIVAGVPQGTKVAHKFGEQKNGDIQQFHDCGIVYHENPYLLCVMTRGDNMQELTPIIQEISKKVYNEVSSRN